MITIATLLWAPNRHSYPFSRYTESDVEKLYRGFARNLSVPFRFVCYVDTIRNFAEPIGQRLINGEPSYASCIQPYEMNEPMILVGLDTIVVGNCDHLAAYCLGAQKMAVPRDPFFPQTVCNGVGLIPAGHAWVKAEQPEGKNDMEWIRSLWKDGRVDVIDDMFPRAVVSYKGHTKKHGIEDETAIVYFHGELKPAELPHVGWIARHWHENVKEAA